MAVYLSYEQLLSTKIMEEANGWIWTDEENKELERRKLLGDDKMFYTKEEYDEVFNGGE